MKDAQSIYINPIPFGQIKFQTASMKNHHVTALDKFHVGMVIQRLILHAAVTIKKDM